MRSIVGIISFFLIAPLLGLSEKFLGSQYPAFWGLIILWVGLTVCPELIHFFPFHRPYWTEWEIEEGTYFGHAGAIARTRYCTHEGCRCRQTKGINF